MIRTTAFLTGADHGVVGDYVAYYAWPLHCLEDLQGPLGLLALLTGADHDVASDYVGYYALPLHCLEDLQGPLGLPFSQALITAL